ncbi:DUF551 domain-containing protein [Klebsiella pneumoniae]|nr:DUF551 domain-containing protein [Klebsiella pneumoniae]MCP6217120.1 DUF551 domain-containing protein [Klebsiella pneumoniae]MDP0893224.1 DUF551 domain-containing protein [Klebsiella pneumoniae]
MTSKLTSEILDEETLAELIAFRRSRVEYCQKEGLPYQKALHDSMMLALEELQERRKPLQDKDLQGVIDALEHPAGINAAGKQVVRHALVEIQERRKADSEPVAEVVSIYGDPEAFGEREIRPLVGIQQMPYGTKLYRHVQPAPVVPVVPVVPDFKKLARELVDNLVDCGGLDEGVKEKYLEWAEKTCRAAMLAADPQLPDSDPATVPGKWIPVSERMPENDVSVLTFDGMYKRVHHAMYGHWQCWEPEKITHWMPLPAASQEVKGE